MTDDTGNDNPGTAPIPREAKNRDGKQDDRIIPNSFAEAVRFNCAHRHFFDEHVDALVHGEITSCALAIIRKADLSVAVDVAASGSRDQAVHAYAPFVHEFLDRHGATQFPHFWHDPSAQQCISCCILELIARALDTGGTPGIIEGHSIRAITVPDIYAVSSEISRLKYRHDEEHQRQAFEIELAEWQQRADQIHSADETKEDDPDLAPAEKARVLRNALRAHNDRGNPPVQDEYRPPSERPFDGRIVFYKRDLDLAEDFFTQNPRMTVAIILDLLRSVDEVCNRCPSKQNGDPLFYTRKGHVLAFLLRHIHEIVAELDRYCDSDYFSELVQDSL